MTASTASPPTLSRLSRLQGMVAQDPSNVRLLEDAADAAYEGGDFDLADSLLVRARAVAPLSATALNLAAMALIARGRHAEALAYLDELVARGIDDVNVRYNAALASALGADYARAEALLDPKVLSAVPAAIELRVRVLHHLGRLQEALALGEGVGPKPPAELAASLSVVALDLGDHQAAKRYAQLGQARPEGLTTLGSLELEEGDIAGSQARFEASIRMNPSSGRAFVGLGLSELAGGKQLEAIEHLDHGAALLGIHPGSWIAAGWAHFVAGEVDLAEARFQRALEADENFAEVHGALAVVALAKGQTAEGERRVEIALRLDRRCLSAALAKSQLLATRGRPAASMAVRQAALDAPLDDRGTTIRGSLVRFGLLKAPERGN